MRLRLQPYASQAATLRVSGCNPMCLRLQPYASQAATICASGCNPVRFGLQPDAPRLAGASAQLQWRHQLRRDITRSTHRHRRRWQPGTPAPAPAPAPAAAPAPALSRSLATLATTLATLATLAPLPPRLPGLLLGPRVLRVREALHPAGEPSAHLRPSSDPPDVPPSLRPGTPAALLKTRHAGRPP